MGKRGQAQHHSEIEKIDALTSRFTKEENLLLNEHLMDRLMGIGDGVVDDDARAKRILRKEIDQKYSISALKKERVKNANDEELKGKQPSQGDNSERLHYMRGNFTKFSKPAPSIPDSMIEKFIIEKNKRSY